MSTPGLQTCQNMSNVFLNILELLGLEILIYQYIIKHWKLNNNNISCILSTEYEKTLIQGNIFKLIVSTCMSYCIDKCKHFFLR